jgi:hypothetical protein
MEQAARELLERARDAHDPASADRARVRAKLAAKIAAGAVLGGSVAKAGVAASSPLVKLVIGLAVAGALGGYAYSRMRQTPVAQSVAQPEPRATIALVPTPAITQARLIVGVEPTPSATAAPTIVVARPKSQPSASTSNLEAETLLLADAQAAIQRKDYSTALAKLDEYERAYPTGVLTEERTAARVVALCGAGRAPESRSLGKKFLARWPRSPLAPRVRDACP